MAHTRHTNSGPQPNGNKSDSYRLGWGDVTAPPGTDAAKRDIPRETDATKRRIFLHIAGELYPVMGEELRTLSESLPDDLPTHPDHLEPEELDTIEQWCLRWNLTHNGQPVDWALQSALESIAHWRATGVWLWCASWGGGVPTRPEGEYNPTIQRLVVEKQSTPRREHKAISEAVQAYKDAGYIETPKLRQPEHVRWAVQYIVGKMSFEEISTASQTVLSNRNDPGVYVRLKALKVLRDVGLPSRRSRGRPRHSRDLHAE